MGASPSMPSEFQDLADRNGFSLVQVKNLHSRFKQLSGNEETLRRENLDIPALANNPIKSQIIEAFFNKKNLQKGSAGSLQEINFEDFLKVMSYFRPPDFNTTKDDKEALRKEKLQFLFNMHDTDNDGTITLAEYRKVVEELLSKSGKIGEETTKDIADAAMLEVASINVGSMEEHELYEGITFEHFEQMLTRVEMESRMHIRFLNMPTTTAICRK